MPQTRSIAAAALIAGTAVLALAGAPDATAQEADSATAAAANSNGSDNGGKAVKDVAPLTGSDIEAFMASIPDVQTWAMRQDAETRALTERRFDAETLAAEPFSVGLQRIQGSQAYDELTDTIRAHGFTEPEQWAVTADRVIRALAALQMEESGPTPDQLDQTRRQVLNNPNLSAAEKEQILASVGMATAVRNVPEGDLQAVTPYAEQLAEALGSQEE
ncbi:hypothetical protein [Caenispirillum salinarum]|uniref:hypothetical protein n=1 Tax=Caenispirillum salinarum TaxID=859058 RepID=UPI00384D662D